MNAIGTVPFPVHEGAPSLELVGFSKRFGALAALDDVSVKIRAGGFHALLGENGAGKSTLVKCVMGYYSADEGQILLNDREVAIAHPRQAHELGLGMVYQHFTLVPNMTVLENFVLSRGDLPSVIDWASERGHLARPAYAGHREGNLLQALRRLRVGRQGCRGRKQARRWPSSRGIVTSRGFTRTSLNATKRPKGRLT